MSHQSILRRLQLPLWFLSGLVVLISWLGPASLAEPPEHVTVKLTIVVTDGKGTPISKAHISIPRQGHNPKGKELGEITGDTDAKGEYTRSADFELTGAGHKVVVTVDETSIEEELPDPKLHDASKSSGGKLTIPIAVLTKEVVKLTVAGTVADENAKPVPFASIAIYISGKESTPQFTDKDGRFKLANLEFPLGKNATRKVRISATNFESYDEDISDDSLRKNANGTLELGVIRISSSQSSSNWEELKNIANFVLWALGIGFILLLIGYAAYVLIGKKSISHRLSKRETDDLLKSINLSVSRIEEDIKTLKKPTLPQETVKALSTKPPPEEQPKTQTNTQASESPADTWAIAENDVIVPPAAPDARTNAKLSYEKLVNKMPVSPEPLYLEVEPPRSAAGKMEDKNTYLLELPHSNGSLVVIVDGNNTGWVFPNPKVAFSTAAVKDVFGNLTEVEYETNKLGIEPMRASRVDAARWMVVAN